MGQDLAQASYGVVTRSAHMHRILIVLLTTPSIMLVLYVGFLTIP